MVRLDEIDIHMLEVLQCDARISVLDLADKVGLSATPCSRRLRRLEEEGVIAKYYAALNPGVMGLDVSAFVNVRVRHSVELAQKFKAGISKMPNVRGCYLVTGSYDYCLWVNARSMQDLSRWVQNELHSMPSVLHTYTSIVVETVKDNAVFPLREFFALKADRSQKVDRNHPS